MYRDDYYTREEGQEQQAGPAAPQPPANAPEGGQGDDLPSLSEVEVIIEKNRSGPRGTVRLLFNKPYNKFASIDYEHEA